MSNRSLPAIPRGADPDLRRFLEAVRQTVQEVSGAVRSTADRTGQYVTMEELAQRFPALLARLPVDGDSVCERGVYEPGVFAAEGAAAPAGLVQTLWLHEPISVTGPMWTDVGSGGVSGRVYHEGRPVYHNSRVLYAER